MLSFFTTLGIGKDDKNFNFENLNEPNPDRKYRLSYLDPMNSNIALVLYKCNSGTTQENKYIVRAFLNENHIKLEACKTVDCDLNEFVNHFKDKILNKCSSSKEVCKL
jgi:hypothetical protein